MENNNYKIGLKLLDENIKKLQSIKKNIKKLNNKYKNNFLHISMEKINKNKLKNTNKYSESRYGNSPVYYNPEGFWYHVVQIGIIILYINNGMMNLGWILIKIIYMM